MNALECLKNVENLMEELSSLGNWQYNQQRHSHKGYDGSKGYSFKISSICDEVGIFDWWNENLSMSQLKDMQSFLKKAIKLGFTGYVCFKVGASGCSNGMWAHKNESTDGYSPDGDRIYKSFTPSYNRWDANINGEWLQDKYANKNITFKELESELTRR